MSKRKQKQSAKSEEQEAGAARKGWPDVFIRLIDAVYDLAQTGNLIALILLAVLGYLFYVTYRLESGAIEAAMWGLGSFLSSEKYYFLPMGLALLISLAANIVQAKVYRSHIQELTEHRKMLVHGLTTGDLSPLQNHTTSRFDVVSNSAQDEAEKDASK